MLILNLKKYKVLLVSIFVLLCLISSYLTVRYLETTYLVSSVTKTVRLVPIYKVDTKENAVAISFDASWGAEHTLDILDILDKYQIKATFFLVNIWLEDYPDMACEIVKRGHEIGLHSVSHPHFSQLSDEGIKKELEGNHQLIMEITGYNASLFRPPFGDYNNSVIRIADELGYITIQWSVDSLDWKDLSAAEIETRVLKKIVAGDIVLFHNNGLHTAEALEPIILALKDKNLDIVPISKLIYKDDYYIDVNGVQRQQ